MKVIKLIGNYLHPGRPIEGANDSDMIRAMHVINRISLVLFVTGLLILLSKYFTNLILN